MIKDAIKNFGKNAMYIFVSMGIFYLFFIIAMFSALGGLASLSGSMLNDVMILIGESVDSSGTELNDFLQYASAQIDWNQNLISIIKQVLDTNWIQNTLNGFLESLEISAEGFGDKLNTIVVEFGTALRALLIGMITLLLVGIALASSVTGFLIRRKTVKTTIKQKILDWVLQPLFAMALTLALGWVALLIKGYAIILFVVAVIVYGMMALTFSWLTYKNKQTKFSTVVNAKNFFQSIFTVIIIIAINVLIFVLIALINVMFALLIIIPVIIYSLKILENNADSYIIKLVNQQKEGTATNNNKATTK